MRKDPLTLLLLLLGECPSNYVFYTFIDLRCLIFELQLWICIFFCSLLMLWVVHAETLMTKGSLLPNKDYRLYSLHQERRFLWCYCVQLRNRNAISHVLKLFGRFLVRRADVFSHLFRTSIPSFSESSVLRDSHSRAG